MSVMLADFFGAMIAEFARARMQADLASVQLARTYASDPMLKNLPIPRFRLPTLSANLPMVVVALHEPQGGAQADKAVVFGPGDIDEAFEGFLGNVLKVVNAHLEHAVALPLGGAVAERLPDEIIQKLKLIMEKMRTQLEGTQAEALLAALMEALEAALEQLPGELPGRGLAIFDEVSDQTERLLSAQAQRKVRQQRRMEPGQLEVEVVTSVVRDFTGSCTNIQISVSEEGLEWSTASESGKIVPRLVPE